MRRLQPLLSTHALRLINLDELQLGKVLGAGGFGEVCFQSEKKKFLNFKFSSLKTKINLKLNVGV